MLFPMISVCSSTAVVVWHLLKLQGQQSRVFSEIGLPFYNRGNASPCKLRHGIPSLDASDPEILGHQTTWIRELPLLLIMLGDKHPSYSKVCVYLLPFFLGVVTC
ncbi:hypothetical protein CK203_083108 [Vitis vinifera]|uniref:Uncharacterized protein n=1 Tax=Vitis vinifera TaxID=29760 RepID=A0A438E9Y1_VITVI|nr:hypothetical protein CK203_083108 [Vitis vinifera]